MYPPNTHKKVSWTHRLNSTGSRPFWILCSILMIRHEAGNCYNCAINGLSSTKLHRFVESTTLNTSIWQSEVKVIASRSKDKKRHAFSYIMSEIPKTSNQDLYPCLWKYNMGKLENMLIIYFGNIEYIIYRENVGRHLMVIKHVSDTGVCVVCQ